MTQYDNTNKGSLWRNDRKEKDTHPDYRGSINVNGQEFWLSAWLKEAGPNTSKAGEKFFSLSIQTKEDRNAQADTLRQSTQPGPVLDKDEIPF